MQDIRKFIDILNEKEPGDINNLTDFGAGTQAEPTQDDNKIEPRPTGQEEGDPYNIINLQTLVDNGQTYLQNDLDKAKEDLKSDQDAWDEEYGETHNADGTPKTEDDFGQGGDLAQPTPEPTPEPPQPSPAPDTTAPTPPSGDTSPNTDTGPDGNPTTGNTTQDTPAPQPTPEPPAEEPAPSTDTTAPDVQPGTGTGPDGNPTDTPATAPSGDVSQGDQDTGANAQGGGQGGAPQDQEGGVAQGIDQADQTPQPDAAEQPDAAPQGDSLANRLDTQTPSLLDAYNDGGRQAMDSVKDLQTALSRLGIDPNGIDGKYGRGTYAAVQEFQRQQGLTVDGEAGPNTMKAIQDALKGQGGKSDDADRQNDAEAPGTGMPSDDRGSTAPPSTVGDDSDDDSTEVDDPLEPFGGAGAPVQGQSVNVRPEEMDRFRELLDKASGKPNTMNASTDMSMRNLLSLMEDINSLTAAEREELTTLYNLVSKSKDPKAQELVKRYTNIVNARTTSTSTTTNTNPRSLEAHKKLAAEFRSGKHPTMATIEKNLLSGMDIIKFNGIWMNATRKAAMEADPKGFRSLEQKLKAAVIGYFNKKYNKGSDTNFRVQNTNDFFKQIQQGQAPAGAPMAQNQTTTSAGQQEPERVDMSWDKDMTDKSKLKEASMNISMNGQNASEIGELMRIMQLAGAPNAAPVMSMDAPEPLHIHNDEDEPCPICGKVHGPEAPTPCGMGEEIVGEDWDNSPNEEYKDHNYMVKDISGGINRQKPKGSERAKDPKVESYTDKLEKALQEKLN